MLVLNNLLFKFKINKKIFNFPFTSLILSGFQVSVLLPWNLSALLKLVSGRSPLSLCLSILIVVFLSHDFSQKWYSIRYNWLPSWQSLHSCLPGSFLSCWLFFSSLFGLSHLWGSGRLKGFCYHSGLRSCAIVKEDQLHLWLPALKNLCFSLTKNNIKDQYAIYNLSPTS